MYTMGMTGRRWEIFCAAVKLFSETSFEAVSVRDIAAAVGLQAGSLYAHFSSKEEILETAYTYMEEFYREVSLPDLDEYLERANREGTGVMLNWKMIWPQDMQEILRQILRIVTTRVYSDERAFNLFYNTAVEPTHTITGPVIRRLIELGELEPFDVEAYLTLRTALGVYSTLCFIQERTLPDDLWHRATDMLTTDVVLKHKTDQPKEGEPG